MVRLTASRGRPGSRSSALGVPVRANSWYASSTTTTPGLASTSATTTSVGRAVPVGLFGLVTSTTSGRVSRIAATAASGSMVKSSARGKVTKAEWVSRAYSGYIEYVGAKLSTVRPGPANACSTWSITSLLPLAAHTLSAVRPWPR